MNNFNDQSPDKRVFPLVANSFQKMGLKFQKVENDFRHAPEI